MQNHRTSNAGLAPLILLAGSALAIACGNGSSGSPNGTGGSQNGVAGSASAAAGSGTSGASQSSGGAANGSGGGQITPTAGATSSGGTSAVAGSPGTAGTNPGTAGTTSNGGATSGTGGSAPGSGGSQNTGGFAGAGSSDPSKKITVWLAGDSTMQPCTTACPCGWGSQFQPYLSSNATVVNSAVGGRSIQTWLYDPNVTATLLNGECVVSPQTYSTRWQAMLDPVTGMKPGDYLFIEFGINDGDPTCNRHVGTALFQTYLGTMAQAAKARGAQPIFLTSTSFMQCTGTTVTPNRGFGPQTKAAGTANGVTVIDLTALSAAFYTTLRLCPNALDFTSTTSAVGKFFCDDHTHFESAGAVQIAGVVAQALRDQRIGLAAYLK